MGNKNKKGLSLYLTDLFLFKRNNALILFYFDLESWFFDLGSLILVLESLFSNLP